MVTPFDQHDNVDEDRLRYLINYLIEEQGAHGLVPCGTTGETSTLGIYILFSSNSNSLKL